jgi:hypothetical protein
LSKKSRQSRARKAAQPTSSAPAATVTPGIRPAREAGFNPDYTYVRKDLRRIGLLAGTFIFLMIVASFLMR